MLTKRSVHLKQQRPAVHWALLELAKLCQEWLDLKPGGVRGAGQIMFALRRAMIAFAHASAGRDIARQLARVRAAMDECEICFAIVHEQSPRIVDNLLRRIEQVLATLKRLEKLELTEWLKVELTPLTTAESGQSATNVLIVALREISERVSLWIRQVIDTNSPKGGSSGGAPAAPLIGEPGG